MARINGGHGFENFDHKAYEIEQAILKKEREEEALKPKRGRPMKPRVAACIYCGNKFEPRVTHIDLSEFESIEELSAEYDDEELHKCICGSCRNFWGISGVYSTPHYPGWWPMSALNRINKAREEGYATILKSQTFGTPSGNNIEVEFGDVFPIKRAGVEISSEPKAALDFYSIDIMVGVENLRLFPWEFGTICWTELMMQMRAGELEAVYLGTDDNAGYYEPSAEMKKLMKNMFGDR